MDISNENKSSNKPFVSIIIPVYNRPNGVRDTLSSVVDQDYPKERYEILVVDNDSDDETPEVIEEFENNFSQLVKGLEETEIQSSYAARNRGIENAQGEVLVFLDADMWVENDFLSVITDEFEEEDKKYLGIEVEVVAEKNTIVSCYTEHNAFQIERYVSKRHFAPTCSLAVSRDIFEEVGFFDKELISSGDYEFGNRVYETGYDLYYTDRTKTYHPARDSFKSLMKKSFRIGRGSYQLSSKYPERYGKNKKNVFNLKHFLPDPPETLKRYIDYEVGMKKFCFAGIKWCDKIVKHIGYVYEKGRW